MNNISGYRGYIGSRAYDCGEFPQNVQNLIIRTYCEKHGLRYLLSATEYTMPGCYMMLQEVVNAVHTVEGIVVFSIFMLPASASKRRQIYQQILSAGKSLHAALEDLSIKQASDIQIVEDILQLNQVSLSDAALVNSLTG